MNTLKLSLFSNDKELNARLVSLVGGKLGWHGNLMSDFDNESKKKKISLH